MNIIVCVYDFSIVPTDVILRLISLCFLKMSNESVTSLKKRVYIKIMIIKLKTRWEAFLICKNNQPKVSLFFFLLSFCMNIMGKPEVLI